MTEPIDTKAIRTVLDGIPDGKLATTWAANTITELCDRLEELEPIVKPQEKPVTRVCMWKHCGSTDPTTTCMQSDDGGHDFKDVSETSETPDFLGMLRGLVVAAGRIADKYAEGDAAVKANLWRKLHAAAGVAEEWVYPLGNNSPLKAFKAVPVEDSPSPLPETVQAVLDAALKVSLQSGDSWSVDDWSAFVTATNEYRADLQPPEPEQLYRVLWHSGKWETVTAEEMKGMGYEGARLRIGLQDGFSAKAVHPLDENGRALAELSEEELADLLNPQKSTPADPNKCTEGCG